MTKTPYQLCQISQVGIWIRNDKCLILKFNQSDKKWGLPGGRIDDGALQNGRTCEQEFRREIAEELGIHDFQIIAVVDYDFTGGISSTTNSPVIGVANLITSDCKQILLSDEHTEYRWIALDEIDGVDFKWLCAKKMIRNGFEYLIKIK